MQTRSSDENFLRLSICLSIYLSVKRVDGDKTEERSVQTFIPYEMVGRPLLPEILGQQAPFGAKSPILNLYSLLAPRSAVTPSEKRSINTNRKFSDFLSAPLM